jgi:hypothetical protein
MHLGENFEDDFLIFENIYSIKNNKNMTGIEKSLILNVFSCIFDTIYNLIETR